MSLPVIQTCGECGHHRRNLHGRCLAMSRRVHWSAAPPSWCPLPRQVRTEDDEAAIEALRSLLLDATDLHAGTCTKNRHLWLDKPDFLTRSERRACIAIALALLL